MYRAFVLSCIPLFGKHVAKSIDLESIVLFLVLPPIASLRCYSCRGGKQCGNSFSTTTVTEKILLGNDLYDTCSVRMMNEPETVDSILHRLDKNGETHREVMPVDACRSSARQFCCNEDLCNGLSAPPLPAFTELSCALSRCPIDDEGCEKSNYSLVYRSSATASCTVSESVSLWSIPKSSK
jgi:hypothetical protein